VILTHPSGALGNTKLLGIFVFVNAPAREGDLDTDPFLVNAGLAEVVATALVPAAAATAFLLDDAFFFDPLSLS
jgi:hypothetical protein